MVLLGIGGGVVVVALGIALVVARNLSRRIEALSRASEALGRGDLEARVKVVGSDEVAQLACMFNEMTVELARARETTAVKRALERELELARRIQTALLPDPVDTGEYRVAGAMLCAEEVGGDFFDVLPKKDHLWLAVGDVSSHGVTPGLVMMMAQSALLALVTRDPGASPNQVVALLNRVLYKNLRERLHDDNHMTLVVLRSAGQGRFEFAGAHLEIAIRRGWVS
jgi:sigma-B regulation protein RsbU (phosphoserine phosphatase)